MVGKRKVTEDLHKNRNEIILILRTKIYDFDNIKVLCRIFNLAWVNAKHRVVYTNFKPIFLCHFFLQRGAFAKVSGGWAAAPVRGRWRNLRTFQLRVQIKF